MNDDMRNDYVDAEIKRVVNLLEQGKDRDMIVEYLKLALSQAWLMGEREGLEEGRKLTKEAVALINPSK